MKSLLHSASVLLPAFLILAALFGATALAQPQARRLILKDGSYQSITKYEIHGDRVRYFSAERGEWEEVPKALIDWDATDKFEHGREAGKLAPEAVELDNELEAERNAERSRSPEVAPGLRLPDEAGIFLLDTFENQPQLTELQQSGADLDKNTKSGILHAMINPLAGAKQAVELPGPHARIQAHTPTPSLFINVEAIDAAPATAQPAGDPKPLAPAARFKIIRIDTKSGKRTAGAVKVAVTGKMSTSENLVAATATTIQGGWLQLTPTEPLAPGEYAVAEMMGKEGMNLYVWDFGVNPAAPANPSAAKPDPVDSQPKSGPPANPRHPEKQ